MAIDLNALPKDVDALKALIADLDHRYEQHLGEKQTLIDTLLEHIRLYKHRQFKPKSEQLAQLELPGIFDEVEQLADGEPPQPAEPDDIEPDDGTKKPGGKKGRGKLPANLPRETIIHDLSEAEKVCSCGHRLHCIGEERSEKLDIIPMQFKVIEHVRPKYACRACEDGIKASRCHRSPLRAASQRWGY